MSMSERQAVNPPSQRAKQVRKRKSADSGEDVAVVADAGDSAAQASPHKDGADVEPDGRGLEPDGRGLEAIEGLIGLAGLGVVGAAAAGLRGGGSGGGEVVPATAAVATNALLPAVGTSIPGRPEPSVSQPVTSTTKSLDPVEETDAKVPGANRPGVVEPKTEPKIEPEVDLKIESKVDLKIEPTVDPKIEPTVDPKIEPTVDPKFVLPVEVDTSPPARPTVALKHDTGVSATDGITSDSTITVSGLEQDATWRYSLDDGKTWRDGLGSEISDIRFDGAHTVQVVQTDRAGHVSEATSLTFTLDTGAPTLSLKSDTGRMKYDRAADEDVLEDEAYGRDGVTKDGTLIVSGLKEGASWRYSLDEGKHWTAGAGNEIESRELGADGRKTVWVSQAVAGEESGVSTFSFVLDTHADRVVPRLKSVDSWDRENHAVTSEPVIVFDGFEEGAVASWKMYGGKPWEGRPSGSSHAAEFSFVGDVPSGRVRLNDVIQTDIAGNSSPGTPEFYFVIAPPDAGKPGLIDTGAPTLSLKSDTGRMKYDRAAKEFLLEDEAYGRDGVTKDGTLIVSGLKEGASWRYSLDEGKHWTAGAGDEIASGELGADGRKTVWVRQKDEDGESGVSTFSFVLDTHAGKLLPRLKSVDSRDRENRPVTSEPVIVFDGYEEGAVANWYMYGGTPGPGSSPTAEVSFVGKLPGGEVGLSGVIQTDIAGNRSPYAPEFYFVFAPPDAGKPGLMVPPSDSIFPG